ncbi:hypothetical protein CWE09_00590 [Aliidiomarina minuta]|uniref:Peptidase M43 pregnancy-associated plasma-A domain-containing protein n=1 Tax=Aliidiomarina minuta TaxID=880057 RepID=A0A432W5D0_9GAMM|nr:hypothetical protein [Aliidiomarina minuta]RUO25270.1 hypothetical protein CWE09_00590 [Aliidiomarina minuta]
MKKIIRPLALALLTPVIFILHSSQTTSSDYWKSLFENSPRSYAYTASYYGVGSASHYLGERYWRRDSRAQALSYYQRAVAQGDAGAAYALSQHIPAQNEQWLRAAAELGNHEASIVVASVLAEESPEKAYALIKELHPEPRQQDMQARLLLHHPELSIEYSWRDVAPRTAEWSRLRKGADLLRHSDELSCSVPVVIYATVPEANEVAFEWVARLEQHELAVMDFCFTLGSAGKIECDPTNGRADCSLAGEYQSEKYQWFITRSGIANARSNQLFMPVDASFSVLVHEMGHWFGLADEYPMSPDLAELFCSGRYRFNAKNIVVTERERISANEFARLEEELPWREHLQQSIGQAEGEYYRLGSTDGSKIGLFRAETCDKTEYQAWKPLQKRTFMQHHELDYIPGLYIELMQQSQNKAP